MSEYRNREFWFYLLPLIAAAISFAAMIWVFVMRAGYPYQIEWIEGSVLQHVVRITEGKPLYQWPDMTYAPALYTPLYYYVSAFFAGVLGNSLPVLRLVSVLATIGSCVCITSSVWRLTGSRLSALLALLLIAMPFKYTGYWFDVARVDSLWTFFVIAAFSCFVQLYAGGASRRWLSLAALLFACAAFTKQTTLFLLPFFALAACCWSGFRSAVYFSVLTTILLLLAGSFLQWESQGLFYFLTMQMAGNHQMTSGLPLHFFKGDLADSIPVFFLLMLYWLYYNYRQSHLKAFGWIVIVIGFLGMTLLSRMYAGGFKNVTMPMHFMIVVLSASGFSVLIQQRLLTNSRYSVLTAACVSFALLLNIVLSLYVPQWSVPDEEDRAYGDALMKRIAAVPGRVCLSRDGYLAYLAGKEFCAHETQLTDILNGGNQAITDSVVTDARQRIMSGYYQVLIVDSITDIGNYVDVLTIPYIGIPLDSGLDERFSPVNGGPRPHLWLELQPDRVRSVQ